MMYDDNNNSIFIKPLSCWYSEVVVWMIYMIILFKDLYNK